MKKNIIVFAVFAFLLLVNAGQLIAGENIINLDNGDAISIRSEIGISGYWGNFDQENSSNGSDISFAYSDLTVGVTYFHDRLFVDFYARTSLFEIGSDWEDNDSGVSLGSEEDISRWELNLTGGYQITERISGFVGVRYASTDSEQEVLGFDNDFEFDTIGVTLGIKGGWVFDKHVYSLLGGVTYAEGDLYRESNFFDTISATPNSWGVVFGGQYRYLFSENIDFSVTIDVYHIDFGTISNSAGDSWELSEETASIRFGVTYTW